MTPQEYTNNAIRDHDEWLEDALAGLLAAGTSKADIQVQRHPQNRTVVMVCGVQKYEWTSRALGQ